MIQIQMTSQVLFVVLLLRKQVLTVVSCAQQQVDLAFLVALVLRVQYYNKK